MTRKQIREYGRLILDEMGEKPLGLERDKELDTFINIAQQNVYGLLFSMAPWAFRKNFKLSTTVNKKTYTLVTDCSVTDFLIMEDIFRNESGKRANPIFGPLGLDQIREFEHVGDTGDPRAWYYESAGVIGLTPTPGQSVSSYLSCYYFPLLADLNDDASDILPLHTTSSLPSMAHPLIALDMARQFCIVSGQEKKAIEDRAAELLNSIKTILLTRQGMNPPIRPDWSEYNRDWLTNVHEP